MNFLPVPASPSLRVSASPHLRVGLSECHFPLNLRDLAIYVWELQTRDYAGNGTKRPKFSENFG
jgi:hypothetical protein